MAAEPRLRRALDAGRLVPAERHAVTGRLTDHARENKRHRPRSRRTFRHLLRTPAGLAGAAVVAVAAVGGVTLAATSGSDGTSATSPREPLGRATAPGGLVAPPGVTAGGQPPPACELLPAAKASQIMGNTMKLQEPKQNNNCSYWSTEEPSHDFIALGWTLADLLDSSRQQAESGDTAVDDLPQLGDSAFGYPSKTTETSPTSREWSPAGVRFAYGGITYYIFLGRTDGESRSPDPAGDEQLAVLVAEQLLTGLKSGAIELS